MGWDWSGRDTIRDLQYFFNFLFTGRCYRPDSSTIVLYTLAPSLPWGPFDPSNPNMYIVIKGSRRHLTPYMEDISVACSSDTIQMVQNLVFREIGSRSRIGSHTVLFN